VAGPIKIERRDTGVVVLTLALPEQRNAMTAELTSAWVAAIDELRGDRSVRAVVVTGEGSAFCAGGDLSWIAESPDLGVDAVRDRMLPFYRSWLSVRELEVPTIAAINGHAIGAGLSLALACDLRYASAEAKVSVPFTALGMHPGMATTYLLTEVVGLAVARELLFTGRRLAADEAQRLGLVNGVFAAEELLSETLAIADQIAGNAPIAMRLTVAGMRGGPHPSLEAALQYEALAQPVTFSSQDLAEGIAAAKARRPPKFIGK
jgi:enoyl-CoA hydratase